LPHLDLGSRRIEYSVVKGPSRRYTYFRFRPDMTLEVALPRSGRKVDVEAALRDRLEWITREYERAATTKRILTPEEVMFGGVYLKVVHVDTLTDELVPDLVNGKVVVRTSDNRRIKELIRRWFLRESSTYVVEKVRESAPLFGAWPSRVDVREISKWGYCTRGGRLSISWQLIALPERLREYVVLHELTHLVHFDHSPAFRRKLASVCPGSRERERELDLIVPYDRMTLM